ncbi:metallophosphoesterase family protein [Risungbinella massiliensis]|uniref:metallophosphoesterase family protein n=1 Tax=Risungbinella massiliensis TaxID=1329796 RepID=UPI0005CC29BB|nr:metallophosphoesterase [Risungbinella massiliensis]
MKIGLIGDIHGRVLHTLAMITTWQIHHQEALDLIIQVGDFGVYPEPDESLYNNKFYMQDPSQFDFSHFIHAQGALLQNLHYIKGRLSNPIHFIRGNHEDFDWLEKLSSHNNDNVISIDSLDIFRYVKDGTVLKIGSTKVGFLGGIETSHQGKDSIDIEKYMELLALPVGEIDILITHDAPYGIGSNYHGEVQGSKKISALIKKIQPTYLIAGHYHHVNGPRMYGDTTYLGLNVIIDLRKDHLGRVQVGSLAILDTEKNELRIVDETWLARFDKNFDFNQFCERLKNGERL